MPLDTGKITAANLEFLISTPAGDLWSRDFAVEVEAVVPLHRSGTQAGLCFVDNYLSSGFRLMIDEFDRFRFTTNESGGNIDLVGSTTLSRGRRYTFRAERSGGTFRTYINGTLESEGSGTYVSPGSKAASLGRISGKHFLAPVSRMRFWDNGALWADYQFNDASGSTITDSSGNARHATAGNHIWLNAPAKRTPIAAGAATALPAAPVFTGNIDTGDVEIVDDSVYGLAKAYRLDASTNATFEDFGGHVYTIKRGHSYKVRFRARLNALPLLSLAYHRADGSEIKEYLYSNSGMSWTEAPAADFTKYQWFEYLIENKVPYADRLALHRFYYGNNDDTSIAYIDPDSVTITEIPPAPKR